MAIDFPVVNSDPSLPWLNPDTGITYIYKDGAWRVLSSSDFADLEDSYVNVSGDTMTGELSLSAAGTVDILQDALSVYHDGNYNAFIDWGGNAAFYDLIGEDAHFTRSVEVGATGDVKITLNADGSAAFASGVEIRGYEEGNDGYGINLNKGLVIKRPPSELSPGFQLIRAGGGDMTDGANWKFAVLGDGAAQFSSYISSGLSGDGGSTGAQGFWLSGSGGNSYASKFSRNTTGDGAVVSISSKDRPDVILLNADGSGNFKGQVRTGDPRTSGDSPGGTIIGTSNDGSLTRLNIFNNTVNTTDVVIGMYSGAGDSRKVLRAHFDSVGNLDATNVSFKLEPDNDANYTVTTDVDEEGNTVENRVYNGPTLDVKDRLQNLIARLDSLEAEELADDATSTLLLTTVNNLNADMTKTKAALTAIRTAANAAGTLEQLKADIATATADI